MRLKLTAWDSDGGDYAINDATNYEANIAPGNAMPSATANFIDLGQGDSILAGKTLDGGYFTFNIILRNAGDLEGEIEPLRDQLNSWFRPNDFIFRKLLAEDLDNGNKEWYLEGYPVTPPLAADGSPTTYSITLALKQPYWLENEDNTDTWIITSDTDTNVIVNTGNMPALPTFTITAIEAKSSNGIAHKDFYAIHTSGWGASKIPVDITGGGIDTAAQVTAGRMLASGDDVGVSLNGVYVPRWAGGDGWNGANTTIWINMSFTAIPNMTLLDTLDGSTLPASIRLQCPSSFNGVQLTNLVMPQNRTIKVDDELITYSTYNFDLNTKIATLIPTSRAAKGSDIDTHSIGAAALIIENEVWLTYGNPDAATPVIDDTEKPIFDLAESTNDIWKYYEFGDTTNLRTGAPIKNGIAKTRQGNGPVVVANWYTGSHGADANPYTEIGMMEGYGFISANWLSWVFQHPGGISNLAGNGSRYRLGSVENWTTNMFIEIRRGARMSWFNSFPTPVYYTVSAPSTLDTWEDFSFDVAVTAFYGFDPVGGSLEVSWSFVTQLSSSLTDPSLVMAELQDATQTNLDPPTCTRMGAIQENYKLSGYLSNDTTNEIINFNDLITKTNVDLTIDCENQEIYSEDGKQLRGMIAFSGAKRDEWMTLGFGSNTFTFSDTGTVQLNIVTTWKGRNTI
jgi:hypothetical protein